MLPATRQRHHLHITPFIVVELVLYQVFWIPSPQGHKRNEKKLLALLHLVDLYLEVIIDKFNVRHRRLITFSATTLENSSVPSRSVRVPRGHRLEEFVHSCIFTQKCTHLRSSETKSGFRNRCGKSHTLGFEWSRQTRRYRGSDQSTRVFIVSLLCNRHHLLCRTPQLFCFGLCGPHTLVLNQLGGHRSQHGDSMCSGPPKLPASHTFL